MSKTHAVTVRQTVSYKSVGEELSDKLRQYNKLGHEVMNVFETKVGKIPGCSDQGFIVVFKENTIKRPNMMCDDD